MSHRNHGEFIFFFLLCLCWKHIKVHHYLIHHIYRQIYKHTTLSNSGMRRIEPRCSVFAHYNHFGTQNSIQFVSALKHLSKYVGIESACTTCVKTMWGNRKKRVPIQIVNNVMLAMNIWFIFFLFCLVYFIKWQRAIMCVNVCQKSKIDNCIERMVTFQYSFKTHKIHSFWIQTHTHTHTHRHTSICIYQIGANKQNTHTHTHTYVLVLSNQFNGTIKAFPFEIEWIYISLFWLMPIQYNTVEISRISRYPNQQKRCVMCHILNKHCKMSIDMNGKALMVHRPLLLVLLLIWCWMLDWPSVCILFDCCCFTPQSFAGVEVAALTVVQCYTFQSVS